MESVSRIGSLLETARELTLDAARDAGPRKARRPLPAAQIKKLLDGRSERDVLEGLRRVIEMQCAPSPADTLPFFPAVLKTLSHPFPSTRPLVYTYLLHHAEADPDTALLAINTIQKSLSDANPRVRAMALKTMSGIRVPVISQIVALAIKKGVADLSPLVRKVAALACVKCVRLDPSTQPQVEEHIATLIADRQYYVAGAAVQAFAEICPGRWDMIHPQFRRLCRTIVDMDEWGQLATLRLLTTYSRNSFPQRTKRVRRAATREDRAANFYEDLEPQAESETEYDEVEVVDPDLELFLTSVLPLLHSRNSAVILAVVRAFSYLSPNTYLPQAVGPLMTLMRSPRDIQLVALHNIVQVCLLQPSLFVPYLRHFLIQSSEAPDIWRLKLELLTLTFPHARQDAQDLILADLEHFSRGHNRDLVRESVRAVGRCAQTSSARTARRCLALLLQQIHSPDPHLVGEAIEVVRHLIQRDPDQHRKTVVRLAKNLDTLTSPAARASVIWLVGEFAAGQGDDGDEGIAADVLRILVRGYADESDQVQAQIVLLAAKVYLHHVNAQNAKQKALDDLNLSSRPSDELTFTSPAEEHQQLQQEDREAALPSLYKPDPISALYHHTLLLARYTTSYDLRDRARLYRALLAIPSSTQLASLLLLASKPVPLAPSPSDARKGFTLGSASLVVGSGGWVEGHGSVPDWVADGSEPDPKLREDGEREVSGGTKTAAGRILDEAMEVGGKENGGVAVVGPAGAGASARKEKTLDAWLDEEDGEESEGETDEEDEDSDDEDEDDDDDDEDDDENEDEDETESEEDENAGLVR